MTNKAERRNVTEKHVAITWICFESLPKCVIIFKILWKLKILLHCGHRTGSDSLLQHSSHRFNVQTVHLWTCKKE